MVHTPLLHVSHHKQLLPMSWISFDQDYYIKIRFDQDEYRLLMTDLRHVWFDNGDRASIIQRANDFRLQIQTDQQFRVLLNSIRPCFDEPSRCRIALEGKKLILSYESDTQGFASFSWAFHGILLESRLNTDADWLDGPTVLYHHFILPLLNVTQNKDLMSSATIGQPSAPTTTAAPQLLQQLSLAAELQMEDQVQECSEDHTPSTSEETAIKLEEAEPKIPDTRKRRADLEQLLEKKKEKQRRRRLF
ncbi:hypothetical protein DM01DRAFT_1407575 [Hesseltinella vesiculosa]|uniref:Non-homologous end-joining factor 1 n=1 Tax=Hesseltinella vesiculosa TaxID=101127 RepID=A0A1X2GHN6_9FUNG|nr:hypothetical protein DM01DRAFT_1407575 [Hesseltinella vesiculosa]